ncbi:MAG: hypothetical protein AB8B51_11665 [Sedimentitalea sp.]
MLAPLQSNRPMIYPSHVYAKVVLVDEASRAAMAFGADGLRDLFED